MTFGSRSWPGRPLRWHALLRQRTRRAALANSLRVEPPRYHGVVTELLAPDDPPSSSTGPASEAAAGPAAAAGAEASTAAAEPKWRPEAEAAEAAAVPNKLPVPSREDCIRNFIVAWMRPSLHLRAVDGNWKLMVRNDIEGREDKEGGGDAKKLWDQLGLLPRRTQVVQDVRQEIQAGRLAWTLEAVYEKLVAAFPKRGQIDQYIEGQEDEGCLVAEDQGALWDDVSLSQDLGCSHGGPPGQQ